VTPHDRRDGGDYFRRQCLVGDSCGVSTRSRLRRRVVVRRSGFVVEETLLGQIPIAALDLSGMAWGAVDTRIGTYFREVGRAPLAEVGRAPLAVGWCVTRVAVGHWRVLLLVWMSGWYSSCWTPEWPVRCRNASARDFNVMIRNS
jgi:hypothetical protein